MCMMCMNLCMICMMCVKQQCRKFALMCMMYMNLCMMCIMCMIRTKCIKHGRRNQNKRHERKFCIISATRKKLSHAKIVRKPRNRWGANCMPWSEFWVGPKPQKHAVDVFCTTFTLDVLRRFCERHTQKTQPCHDRWKTKKPIGRSMHAMIRILSCTQTTKKRSASGGVSPDFPYRCFAPCLSVPHAKNSAVPRSSLCY